MDKLYSKIHSFLIPHESNNYKARSLHASTILLYIIFLLVFQITRNIIKSHNPEILGFATDISTERLLEEVNKKRVENNLKTLNLSDKLSSAAQNKANDMFAKNYWAHISPTGVSPWVFITESGYNYVYAGENLARSFSSSEEVVAAWMNSSTHRANLLKPEYTDIGFAVMNGKLNGEETTLVVQEFGTPVGTDLTKLRQVTEQNKNNSAPLKETNFAPQQKIFFQGSTFTKTVSIYLAEFLLIILLFDCIYIWRHKIFRIGSHNIAHIIFLSCLIGAMGATGFGIIL